MILKMKMLFNQGSTQEKGNPPTSEFGDLVNLEGVGGAAGMNHVPIVCSKAATLMGNQEHTRCR